MSEEMEKKLPYGWRLCLLGDVMYLKNGYAFKSKDYSDAGIPLVRISDLQNNEVTLDNVVYIPQRFTNNDYLVEQGDLLIAMSGATTGKTGVYKGIKPVLQNQRVGNFRIIDESIVNKKYRDYFIASIRNDIEKAAYGGAQPNISAKGIEKFEFPLAPLEQQKQIVAKIEQLFSHIDAGIEALNTAKQRLKQYRQSVLKAAVTGELSKEWREAQQNIGCAEVRSASIPHAQGAPPIVSTSYESADKLLERILQTRRQKWEEQQLEQFKAKGKLPKNDKWKEKYKEPVHVKKWRFLSVLPDSWSWVSVDQIGDSQDQPVLTGPFGSNLGKNDFIEQGIPLLTIGCLKEAGIDLSKVKYISEKKAEDLNRYKLKDGDLLFSRMAAVGRVGFVKSELEGALFNYHIMRLRLHPLAMEQEYFVTYVRGSREVYEYVKEVNHGATRDGINTQQLLEMPVALAPFQEQKEICRVVGDRLSVIRKLEQDIEIQLQKAQKTKQSILSSAFSGKLTNL